MLIDNSRLSGLTVMFVRELGVRSENVNMGKSRAFSSRNERFWPHQMEIHDATISN
jgi:hypothetical protein